MSDQQIQQLRAAYGEGDWTVYDRYDRWMNEHRGCNWHYQPDHHEDGTDFSIRTIECQNHQAVVVYRVV